MKFDDLEFADSEIVDINLGIDFMSIRVKYAYNLVSRDYIDDLTIYFAGLSKITTRKHIQSGLIEIDSDPEDSLPKIISNFECKDNEVIISGSSKKNTNWYDTSIKFKDYRIMPNPF